MSVAFIFPQEKSFGDLLSIDKAISPRKAAARRGFNRSLLTGCGGGC